MPNPRSTSELRDSLTGCRRYRDLVAEGPTLYERVGGLPFFERLVDTFYDGVADDPALVVLYPDAPDLSGARHRLTLFLAQYWGGPTTYSEERGHPRLRLRHMREAIAWADPPPAVAARLHQYFDMAAEAMRNRD